MPDAVVLTDEKSLETIYHIVLVNFSQALDSDPLGFIACL